MGEQLASKVFQKIERVQLPVTHSVFGHPIRSFSCRGDLITRVCLALHRLGKDRYQLFEMERSTRRANPYGTRSIEQADPTKKKLYAKKGYYPSTELPADKAKKDEDNEAALGSLWIRRLQLAAQRTQGQTVFTVAQAKEEILNWENEREQEGYIWMRSPPRFMPCRLSQALCAPG